MFPFSQFPFAFKRRSQSSPRTAFRLSTTGSATQCLRAHWRFVLTTPTCRCPGADADVSTDSDKMAVSPSVSAEPGSRQRPGYQWLLSFIARAQSLLPTLPIPPHYSHNAVGEIIISPGSSSTDRSATSSSSSDRGP